MGTGGNLVAAGTQSPEQIKQSQTERVYAQNYAKSLINPKFKKDVEKIFGGPAFTKEPTTPAAPAPKQSADQPMINPGKPPPNMSGRKQPGLTLTEDTTMGSSPLVKKTKMKAASAQAPGMQTITTNKTLLGG